MLLETTISLVSLFRQCSPFPYLGSLPNPTNTTTNTITGTSSISVTCGTQLPNGTRSVTRFVRGSTRVP